MRWSTYAVSAADGGHGRVVRDPARSFDRSKDLAVPSPGASYPTIHRPSRAARRRSPRWVTSPATCAGPGTPRPRTSSRPSTPTCGSRPAATRSGCSARSAAPGSTSWRRRRSSWPRSAPRTTTSTALPDRRPLVPAPAGRGRRRPGRDRLLLAGVRHHRGAAAVLRRPRHPGRRPPEGRQRPRRTDHRRRPALPARLLQAVALPRGLAAGDLPGPRPRRAADLAAARGERRRAR